MHHGPASKIERAAGDSRSLGTILDISQDSAAPHPMSKRAIDQCSPKDGEDHHRAKLHAFSKSSTNERWCDNEEHALKQHVREARNLGSLPSIKHGRYHRVFF